MATDWKQVSFDEVWQQEQERIKARRNAAGLTEGDPQRDAVGLAFSGGGIRSATFNLGILQALARARVLDKVDYLSTVSGGGYIGSSLTWFMSFLQGDFPYGTSRKDNERAPGGVVGWIRRHGCYLTPGDGLGLPALIYVLLRGTLLNLLVLLPMLLLFSVGLLSLPLNDPGFLRPELRNGYGLLILLAAVAIAVGALAMLTYGVFSSFKFLRGFSLRRKVSTAGGWCLKLTAIGIAIGVIPWLYEWLHSSAVKDWADGIISMISAGGGGAIAAAWGSRNNGNETGGWRAALLYIGVPLLAYGVLLWLYEGALVVTLAPDEYSQYDIPAWAESFWNSLFFAGLPLSVLLAVLGNINHVSMHRYYRDRLVEAFMPDAEGQRDYDQADGCLLKDIGQTKAPYHLINTMALFPSAKSKRAQLRGGENFLLSPLYCGSRLTCYAATDNYVGGSLDLGSACSISGAAVDPDTGATDSPALSFIMTLLNLRLGYWIRNPKHPSKLGSWSRPLWYVYALREMLGINMNEDDAHVRLSDGGHFENLATYELIRRGCKWIITCDAGADPDWSFGDLANLVEKVRVDFGANIDIDTQPLRPQGEDRISSAPYVKGTITYKDGSSGTLIYIKTCVIADLPEDIYGYRRVNPSFPDQSTGDQFFDEAQFEAYRELGFQLAHRVFPKGDDLGAVK